MRVSERDITKWCLEVGLKPIPGSWDVSKDYEQTEYTLLCEGDIELYGHRYVGDEPDFTFFFHKYADLAKLEKLADLFPCNVSFQIPATPRARMIRHAMERCDIYTEVEEEIWNVLRKYDLIGEDGKVK